MPEIRLKRACWPELLDSAERAAVEKILPGYVVKRRWFGGKAGGAFRARISGAIPLGDGPVRLALIEVVYHKTAPQTYLLPLAWKEEHAAAGILKNAPEAAIAGLELSGRRGLLYDAAYDRDFHALFLSLFTGKRRLPHW